MYEDIVHQFDAYMKKSIRNCVIRFARKENLMRTRETSLDELSEKINNDETVLLSDKGNCAVFAYAEENREQRKLEEYFSNDKVVQAVKELSEEEKEILILSILDEYTSDEIGKMYNKSGSTIRVIIHNAKQKIRKKRKESENEWKM